MLAQYFKALRPEQWSKNLVVFAGLIFAREFTNTVLISKATLAFVLFCLASSSMYLINDLIDYQKDKLHPRKSLRPIASGKIAKSGALILAVILIITSLTGAFHFLNKYFFAAICSYVILSMLYSFFLKKVVIIDVMSIAAGFVLRAVGGAAAINVEISAWLVVCTTLLALFLSFGKRRHELVLLEANAANHRGILAKYSVSLLDQLISIVTAATIISYAFYTLSGEVSQKLGVEHLELTIPFVIYGIFRYLFLIHKMDAGGSPARILYSDLPILICVLLWITSVLILMYV